MNAVEAYMQENGFALADTGGGCTAYERLRSGSGYVLITRRNDPVAPTALEEPCTVGFFDADGMAMVIAYSDTLRLAVRLVVDTDDVPMPDMDPEDLERLTDPPDQEAAHLAHDLEDEARSGGPVLGGTR
jgi:hypothetical protein